MSVYEKTLLDPASAFTSPEQVLTSAELSREQKIEILHRWEYDARQMEVAEEANMLSDSDQPDILDEILPDLAERRRETGGRTATVYEIKSGGDVPMSYLDRLEDQFPKSALLTY